MLCYKVVYGVVVPEGRGGSGPEFAASSECERVGLSQQL